MKARTSRGLVLVGLLSAVARCGGGEIEGSTSPGDSAGMAGAAGAAGATAVVGAKFSVRIDEGSVTLARGDTSLLSLPLDAFQLGTVDALDDHANYDPYFMAIGKHTSDPEGLAFHAATSARITSTAPVTVELAYPRGTATLTVKETREGSFELRLVPNVANVAYFRLRPRVDATEGLYGLGENFDKVDNRGIVRPMQLELGSKLESGYTLTHAPIPFVTGTRGWGLYVASEYPGVFDVCAAEANVVEATFAHGLDSQKGVTFHLFAADHPLDVSKRYYDLTGYPRLPARWALGPWLWRNGNADQATLTSDLETMRKLDLPHTGLWIDNPFKTAVESFSFSPKMFTDPKGLVDLARSLGFKMAVWSVPYLDPKAEGTATLLAEAKAKGFMPQKGLAITDWGPPIDFTNPAARTWWKAHLVDAYRSVGIEGFKLDYGEEVVPGLAGARAEWAFFDGTDERVGHARYGILYHQVYQETLDPEGSFLLCRHGNPGDQVNVSVMWPGDLDTTWAKSGDPAIDDKGKSYLSVGGFPASIIAGLSLSPSGFPFYGADTAGYLHAPADKELFTRWFQQTALSTVMQIGNQASAVAWEKIGDYDDEMLGWYRDYTRLHVRLFPYLWTHAQRIAVDGRPITRAFGLAYPELGVHPDDVYLLGDDLLVAPVVEPNKRDRTLRLPPGDWIDWWSGERHAGGVEATVAAPLSQLPLFVRASAIVPLLRPTIDTLSPTTATGTDAFGGPLVDSYATTPGVLYPRVVAGPRSTFTLFDGGTLTQELSEKKLTLSSKSGAELAFGARFEVIAFGPKPSAVMIDGAGAPEIASEATLEQAATGWTYDTTLGGRLLVKVGPGDHSVTAE